MDPKHYRINVGTVKCAAFWNAPKEEGQQGYYSVTIARSRKDSDGNWIEDKINLFPNEMLTLIGILNRMQNVVLQPKPFEIKKAEPEPQAEQPIGDEIPF